jgi:hypothetical protein
MAALPSNGGGGYAVLRLSLSERRLPCEAAGMAPKVTLMASQTKQASATTRIAMALLRISGNRGMDMRLSLLQLPA